MTITVTLNDAAGVLSGNGSSLYAFRAVTAINAAALPSVWSRKRSPFPKPIQLAWTNAIAVYVSTTPAGVGNAIVPGAKANIKPGQTFRIDSQKVATVVKGQSGTIGFFNGATVPLTCGLMQSVNGAAAPFCAFPVGPNMEQEVVPSGAILLLFSTANLAPGTIVADAEANAFRLNIDGGNGSEGAGQTQGVLVIDTSVPRTLTYSTATGSWQWGNGVWARTVQPYEPIVPLLIQSPSAAQPTSRLLHGC